MTTQQPKIVRAPAIDIARGLAVAGVVASHSVQGLENSGLVGEHYLPYEVITSLGMLRLPALALLLGLFIPDSMERRGRPRYLRERLVTLGYLYLVWSLVQGSITVLASGVRNRSSTWIDVITFWTPDSQLWFLPYVMVATIVIAFLKPWSSTPLAAVALVIGLAITASMWGRNYNVVGAYGLSLLFFSTLGATIGLRGAARALKLNWAWWSAIAVASTAGFIATLMIADPAYPARGESGVQLHVWPLYFTSSLIGILALIAWSKLLSLVPVVSPALQRIGRSTLEIFVMHMTVYAGVRVILIQVGVTSPTILLTASVVAGIVIPIFFAQFAPRIKLGWLFKPPAMLLGPVRTRSNSATVAQLGGPALPGREAPVDDRGTVRR